MSELAPDKAQESGSLDRTQTSDVRAAARAEQIRAGMSQRELADAIGHSRSAVSEYFSGKPRAINADIEKSLLAWLNQRREAENLNRFIPRKAPFIKTPTADRIWKILSTAHSTEEIWTIVGEPGVSKTMTLAAYRKHYNNVWVIEVDSTTAGSRSALIEIYETITRKEAPKAPTRKIKKLIQERIHAIGGLLVFDEAQHFTDQTLDLLRRIHDTSDFGMVFVGNFNVLGAKGQRDSQFHQFNSRNETVEIRRVTEGDVRAIAEHYDLLGPDVFPTLVRLAAERGALRRLVKIITRALMACDGKPITSDLLEECSSLMRAD